MEKYEMQEDSLIDRLLKHIQGTGRQAGSRSNVSLGADRAWSVILFGAKAVNILHV
jgi:hypothetical protein